MEDDYLHNPRSLTGRVNCVRVTQCEVLNFPLEIGSHSPLITANKPDSLLQVVDESKDRVLINAHLAQQIMHTRTISETRRGDGVHKGDVKCESLQH